MAANQPDKKTNAQLIQEFNSSDTVISPDGKWLVFTKKSNFIVPSDCFYAASKGDAGQEIWIVDLATKQKKVLVTNHFNCDDVKQMILNPRHLEFSPNSQTLYFQTSAWVVSDAIHAIDVNGENLRFVTDGNKYQVIRQGPYQGNLLVNQHRYHSTGGSFDADWIYSPEGKKIKLYKKED